jgi:hypothetical protein|tara:strand:- start:47 stop:484 length:438 start_codon:yes stop_codon:yes gene_type:complete
MNPSIEIIGTLHGTVFILTAVYGAIQRKRNFFLFGICFFCTLPVAGETIAYAQDNNISRLFVIVMFLTQIILTLPSNIPYGYKELAAMALNKRIGYSILALNLFQGYVVLNNILEIPLQFGYMHFAISLIMFYTLIRSEKDKTWS